MAGGEHVEDRDGALGRQLLEQRVRARAHADGVDVAREHERRVPDRLAARELHLVGAQDHRVPAELDDPRLEGDARARRRLLEDERDDAVAQRVRRARRGLQLGGAVQQRPQLVGAQLGAGEEVARQARGGYVAMLRADLEPLPRPLGPRRAALAAGATSPRSSPRGSGTSRCCRRCRRGGRRRSAARAGRSARTALTSRNWLLPVSRWAARRRPDLDQVVGRRRQRDPRARRARGRASPAARCARGPSGAWSTACAWSAGGGSATCTRRRTPRRARRPTWRARRPRRSRGRRARPSSSAATSTRAGRWRRASSTSPATASTTSSRRRLRAGEPGRTLERGQLSDHAPVLAHVA